MMAGCWLCGGDPEVDFCPPCHAEAIRYVEGCPAGVSPYGITKGEAEAIHGRWYEP